ncbi:hypothetical protein SRHO_G00080350 [Serrasalmus rhombeus]
MCGAPRAVRQPERNGHCAAEPSVCCLPSKHIHTAKTQTACWPVGALCSTRANSIKTEAEKGAAIDCSYVLWVEENVSPEDYTSTLD